MIGVGDALREFVDFVQECDVAVGEFLDRVGIGDQHLGAVHTFVEIRDLFIESGDMVVVVLQAGTHYPRHDQDTAQDTRRNNQVSSAGARRGRTFAWVEEVDRVPRSGRMVRQHSQQRRVAPGIRQRRALHTGRDLHHLEGIERYDFQLQRFRERLHEQRMFGGATANHNPIDPPSSFLSLRGGDRAADFTQQRAGLNRLIAGGGQSYGTHERHLAIGNSRQIGTVGQHIDDQGALVVLQQAGAMQQRGGGKGAQDEATRRQLARGADLPHLVDLLGRQDGRQDIDRIPLLTQLDVIQRPVVADGGKRLERLEPHHVGDFFGRPFGQRQRPQFNAGPSQTHQRIAAAQIAL